MTPNGGTAISGVCGRVGDHDATLDPRQIECNTSVYA